MLTEVSERLPYPEGQNFNRENIRLKFYLGRVLFPREPICVVLPEYVVKDLVMQSANVN